MTFNIKSIAIIGAGPAGIASLYEFLHTNADGTSTVGGARSADPAFTKVVAFEQKDKAGGIWAPSFDEADYPLPPQNLLNTHHYNDPDVIHPPEPLPQNLELVTVEAPLVKPSTSKELQWSRSGVYSDLFTNVPNRFTRFSYLKHNESFSDKTRLIYPFLSGAELTSSIEQFVETEGLNEYIRTHTRVENIQRKNGKWKVTARRSGIESEEWYTEEFDAVVVSNGHYTVPSIPFIPGLAEFNDAHPGVLIHSKSYRSTALFKDKKVLFVGGGISTVNLLQYAYPVAKSVTVSKRGPTPFFPWMNQAVESEGITSKPTIDRFLSETNEVLFSDGTKETGFDVVIFTTGYHYHYPFLEKYLTVNNPSSQGRVSGLFHDTFSIEEPTLGTVGIAISILNFHTIEASASALAGVWSNAKKLPSQEEQERWVEEQVEVKGSTYLFHCHHHDSVKAQFVDPLHQLAAVGRSNPLEVDGAHLGDIEQSFESMERLFYRLKTGEITPSDTLLLSQVHSKF
ncbi:hypothetical protein BABINDRAFT_30557 [Babjeviella inositovora NRRL Y-12698]|uniref:FAD/NAD(P)-binding domain-containing protein n=1 Tax=Babjeviella inositovora NRRL Y-12698 TaxID=984486 RepID=A0A1E3QYX7_9ASCO|nr:uncharacterized protein BABINDRAFT_30557 [Babjeviella inositovora NRRL Y-12698]ODQ82873.1 hypothetical protein BABINDRAFT_30557 [Babjeviella inositovora NRRL Y-12698]